MLIKADIDQLIVTVPAVGMDDAVDVSLATNNGLQRSFGGVGGGGRFLCKRNAIATFEQAKDDGFAECSAFAFTTNLRRFIGFQCAGQRLAFGIPDMDTLADVQVNGIDRRHRYTRQGSTFGSRQIQCKVTSDEYFGEISPR